MVVACNPPAAFTQIPTDPGTTTITGPDKDDLWGVVYTPPADLFTPGTSQLVHYDTNVRHPVTAPPAFAKGPGGLIQAFGSAGTNEVWLASTEADSSTTPGKTPIVWEEKVDGTTVDHSADFPVLSPNSNEAYGGPLMLAGNGQVVIVFESHPTGAKIVRYANGTANPIASPPAIFTGFKPVLVLGANNIFFESTAGDNSIALFQFDGTNWNQLQRPALGNAAYVSYGTDSWAFDTSLTQTSPFTVYHLNGTTFEPVTFSVKTNFSVPASSSWLPVGLVPLSGGKFAWIGQVSEGQKDTATPNRKMAFRKWDGKSLSTGDTDLTTDNPDCQDATAACQAPKSLFGTVFQDGSVLMKSSSDASQGVLYFTSPHSTFE
jgi:hypothetical protein